MITQVVSLTGLVLVALSCYTAVSPDVVLLGRTKTEFKLIDNSGKPCKLKEIAPTSKTVSRTYQCAKKQITLVEQYAYSETKITRAVQKRK